MLSRSLAAVLLTACFWTGAACAANNTVPYHVGETWRVFHPALARDWRGAQTKGLVTTIWYPTELDVSEAAHDIGAPGDLLFRGHPMINNASLSASNAKYPLILLSHGTGGAANNLDWLASALAAQGYIVAGVNHPGNNALEPLSRDGFMLWWERATDVSEMLDGILADPMFAARIDPDRVGAAGFSLGGYTVLELAGARTNLQAFDSFCRSPLADAICHPPEMDRLMNVAPVANGPSQETMASMARAGASYRDQRIKAVFAIAPALGEAFDKASFTDVVIPVSLLAGTADVTAPIATNIQRIAELLPNAKVALVPGASHYTFLDTCLPAVTDRLASICKDPPGVDRDAVHTQTAEMALDFFGRVLVGR